MRAMGALARLVMGLMGLAMDVEVPASAVAASLSSEATPDLGSLHVWVRAGSQTDRPQMGLLITEKNFLIKKISLVFITHYNTS